MRNPCIGSTMMSQILATDEVNLIIRCKSMTTKISPKIAEKLALLSHTPVIDTWTTNDLMRQMAKPEQFIRSASLLLATNIDFKTRPSMNSPPVVLGINTSNASNRMKSTVKLAHETWCQDTLPKISQLRSTISILSITTTT